MPKTYKIQLGIEFSLRIQLDQLRHNSLLAHVTGSRPRRK